MTETKEPIRTITIHDVDTIPSVVSDLVGLWYYTEVYALSEDYAKRVAEGEWGAGADFDEDTMRDDLRELIDGHEFVIYTYKAGLVCMASSNDDAYAEEFGDEPSTIEAKAMLAMLRDVEETSTLTKAIEAAQEDPIDAAFDRYQYDIGEEFLPALINGDTSGLSDDDVAALDRFVAGLPPGDGHWGQTTEDAEASFEVCEVCDLRGNCEDYTYFVAKEKA